MLIEHSTWAELHSVYDHVQIEDMHQADKDRIFKEAVNSHSDELQAIVHELVADDWVRPIVWQNHRHAQQKMASDLWAHVHAKAQDEADEWEDERHGSFDDDDSWMFDASGMVGDD